jgi:hypothetical protein
MFQGGKMAFNVVELMTLGEDDNAFDQPCRFGHRVEGHAVYCHHDDWEDSPRKCRRSWYTGGKIKDEDCAGFEPNPEFKGDISPSHIAGETCSKCLGRKRVKTDRGKTETCPICVGSGVEPKAIALTVYEQDTLEIGTGHSGMHDTAGHPFVRVAQTPIERKLIEKLCELDLVELRSVTFAGKASVYLLENTMKGEAVMRANWKAAKV